MNIDVDKLIDKLTDLEKKKVECEIKINMLKEEKEKILNEIKELGIDPKNIDEELKNIKNEIEANITILENLK